MPNASMKPNSRGRLEADQLRLAQDRVRGLARRRVGFLLRENPLGPLTGMNQFHRVMFTLCTYLKTLEAHA